MSTLNSHKEASLLPIWRNWKLEARSTLKVPMADSATNKEERSSLTANKWKRKEFFSLQVVVESPPAIKPFKKFSKWKMNKLNW